MPRLRYGQGCQLWAATMLALLVGAMCDEPFIDRLVPCNAPTQGGSLVTLIGNSFGAGAYPKQPRLVPNQGVALA